MRIDDGKPIIRDMSRAEMIEELVTEQRGVIERMDDHTMAHQVMRVRSAHYVAQLVEESECGHGANDGEPSPFPEGQYL